MRRRQQITTAASGLPARPPVAGHRIHRFVTIAAVAILAMVAAPLTATASSGDAPKPPKIVTQSQLSGTSYNGPVMYIAPSGDKSTPAVTGNGSSINGYHATTICPLGCGGLTHGFSTTYDYSIGAFTSCFQNMNGFGNAGWNGTSPYSANNMALNQNIWVSGIGVSISYGGSVGAGVSISNNTVYFSESQPNVWQLSHSFTNLRFCTKLGMTGPYENSVVAATFGTHTYRDYIN